MNVIETLAKSLIHEYLGSAFSPSARTTSHLWQIGDNVSCAAAVAYGDSLMALPPQLHLSPPAGGYRAPVHRPAALMNMGISPITAFMSPMNPGIDSHLTPLHVASALLVFGGATHRDMAVAMATPKFLLKVYARLPTPPTPSSFVQNAAINPTSPEDFGLAKLRLESLVSADETAVIVDSLGCASWFEPAYVERLLRSENPALYLNTLERLHKQHGTWEAAVKRAAHSRMTSPERMEYTTRARFINLVAPEQARAYLSKQTGAAEVLWTTFTDATAKEMAKGLRIIASDNPSGRVHSVLRVLGRPLTYADLCELTPLQMLRVLHSAPMGAIQEVTQRHTEELGARLFALTKSHLHTISNCMSPHDHRQQLWWPGGNDGTTVYKQETWETRMQGVVQRYQRAESWRNELLAATDSATAFLLLLRKSVVEYNRLPGELINSVLRSCPNLSTVQEIVDRTPGSVFPHMKDKGTPPESTSGAEDEVEM